MPALDAGGRTTRLVSSRAPERHIRGRCNNRRCGGRTRSASMLAAFALAIVGGSTTIMLQLVASRNSRPRHTSEAQLRAAFAAESSDVGSAHAGEGLGSKEARSNEWDTEPPPYGFVDLEVDVPDVQVRIKPLVDRRFTGQRTGQPPKPEEQASG